MKILGIDYGDKNIGLSLAEDNSIAVPYKILDNYSKEEVLEKLKDLILEENIKLIVVGMPYSLDGTENNRTKITRDFISFLEDSLNMEVKIINEQFTSKLYEKIGIKKDIDKYSATAILDTYLEKNK